MFDWFSLDIIYWPVSAIMWVWYKAFAFILGPSNFFAWVLSVMFLVFTLRAILYKPFVRQIRTTRQMQELQPQIKALQKKYGKDRQRMALEMQKLQREHGFNPMMGCLPMLAQVPVFLGLYHVLRSFNRTRPGGYAAASGRTCRWSRTGRRATTSSVPPTSGTSWTRTCSAHRLVRRWPISTAESCLPCQGAAFTEFNRDVGDRSRSADDDRGRHRDVLQQPRIDSPAEPRGRGQPADGDDEQAGAVRVSARRGALRGVPADGDHLSTGSRTTSGRSASSTTCSA